VAHSQSPFIHAEFARQTGQALSYDRVLVPLDGFARAMREFADSGARGCNVTVPFKFEVPALADRLSPRATLAQAANTLRFDAGGWFADNTDGIGLVRDIEGRLGLKLRGRAVLMLGAGGAARGALGPLQEAGCARLTVANRSLSRAAGLGTEVCGLEELGPKLRSEGAWNLVINATSAGLSAQTLPIDAQVLAEADLVYDMVYAAQPTDFLKRALALGARQASDGLGMLVAQAAEAYRLWQGVTPNAAPVYAALRASLSGEALGQVDGPSR